MKSYWQVFARAEFVNFAHIEAESKLAFKYCVCIAWLRFYQMNKLGSSIFQCLSVGQWVIINMVAMLHFLMQTKHKKWATHSLLCLGAGAFTILTFVLTQISFCKKISIIPL